MFLDLSVTLAGFVAWCREHISGDEKGGAGDTATGPGLPPSYPDPARLVTPDCLGASSDSVRGAVLL